MSFQCLNNKQLEVIRGYDLEQSQFLERKRENTFIYTSSICVCTMRNNELVT